MIPYILLIAFFFLSRDWPPLTITFLPWSNTKPYQIQQTHKNLSTPETAIQIPAIHRSYSIPPNTLLNGTTALSHTKYGLCTMVTIIYISYELVLLGNLPATVQLSSFIAGNKFVGLLLRVMGKCFCKQRGLPSLWE